MRRIFNCLVLWHALADEPADDRVCVGDYCVPKAADLHVYELQPGGGSIRGGTLVVVRGAGFRDFGTLMRCRFGSQEMVARLTSQPGEWVNPYNHTLMACESPPSTTERENSVAFEVSLNGEDFTSDGLQWNFIASPALDGLSPERGSASTSQQLTLTRNVASASTAWLPGAYLVCRFEAVVDPEGKRQVQFRHDAVGEIVDDSLATCDTPTVDFLGAVHPTVEGRRWGLSVQP